MNQINDLTTLSDIVNNYYAKNTLTNNYLLLNDYSQYIAEKKLHFITNGSNICFLVDKAEFFQMYYYINNQKELINISYNKPITMEILYRGEDRKPNEIIGYWERCGFKQHILRVQMAAKYSQMKFFEENESVLVKYAETEEEILFAQNAIEQAFDKYTGHILSLDEVRSLAKKQDILCAYFEGTICGTIKFEIKNNVVVWGALVVIEGFRGKGIAMKLMQTYFRLNARNPDTYYTLWVRFDNTAKNIYQRSGFEYNNKYSLSMLMED